VIADNGPKSPQTLALAGFGTYINLTLSTLNFGNQTEGTKSASKRIVLINKGGVAVSISGVSIAGTDPGDFSETTTAARAWPPGQAARSSY
jgi:hypothetical protein